MKCKKCGKQIGYFEKYCESCKNDLSLRDKAIEGIRHDKIYGSQSD